MSEYNKLLFARKNWFYLMLRLIINNSSLFLLFYSLIFSIGIAVKSSNYVPLIT